MEQENKVQVIPSNQGLTTSLLSPKKLYTGLVPTTIAKIVDNPESRALSSYKKELGPEKGTAYIHAFLNLAILDAISNLNLSNSMSKDQVTLASTLIANQFFYLTAEDIKLAFQNGVMGQYGALYGRLDVQVLCGWIGEYEKARMEYAINRHSKYKENYDSRDGKINNEDAYKASLNRYLNEKEIKGRKQ